MRRSYYLRQRNSNGLFYVQISDPITEKITDEIKDLYTLIDSNVPHTYNTQITKNSKTANYAELVRSFRDWLCVKSV